MKVITKKETGLYRCKANNEEETVFTAKSIEMEEKALASGGVVGRYGSAMASYEPIMVNEEKDISPDEIIKYQMLMNMQKWYMGRGLI